MREIRIHTSIPLTGDTTVQLDSTAARHIAQVLRVRVGQALVLFDGTGGEYPAVVVSTDRNRVSVSVGTHVAVERESHLHLSLWHGLCRAERMDTVVQKSTELGVASIQPMLTERSLVKLDERRAQKKLAHWQKIAISACEQCGRNRIPQILPPVRYAELLQTAGDFDTGMLLDPTGQHSIADTLEGEPKGTRLLICTGPEGGFTTPETDAATRAGLQLVHAGPRILRTETAPTVALAIAQLVTGDLREKR